MNEFLKMDIFFIIASVAMTLVVVLGVILLVYLIKFVKNLKYISDQARDETDNIRADIHDFRQNIRSEGLRAKHIFSFLGSLINRKKKGK